MCGNKLSKMKLYNGRSLSIFLTYLRLSSVLDDSIFCSLLTISWVSSNDFWRCSTCNLTINRFSVKSVRFLFFIWPLQNESAWYTYTLYSLWMQHGDPHHWCLCIIGSPVSHSPTKHGSTNFAFYVNHLCKSSIGPVKRTLLCWHQHGLTIFYIYCSY